MKKLIALLLALVMVLSLAACGAKEEAPAAEAPAADGKIEVTMIAAQYGTQTADWWADFVEKFNAANEGINLVVDVVSWNHIYTVVNTRIANGENPSISAGVMDRIMCFDNGYTAEELAAVTAVVDAFYDDEPYSEWVLMEDFLPATTAGGEAMAAANPDAAAWIEIVGSAKFYPTAKAEWADVKQGVIDVLQQALLGENVQELLDNLQAEIAG